MIGTIHKKGTESVMIFNTRDAVLFLTEDELDDNERSNISFNAEYHDNASSRHYSKKLKAYPAEWAHSFGEQYYATCADSLLEEPADGHWKTDEKGLPYKEADANVTTPAEAAVHIKQILGNIGVDDESV